MPPHLWWPAGVSREVGSLIAGGMGISLERLLGHVGCVFGDVHDCNSMVWSLYTICHRECKTVG